MDLWIWIYILRNCQKLLVEGCGAAGHGKQAGSPQCHEHPGATQQLRGCTGARELGLGVRSWCKSWASTAWGNIGGNGSCRTHRSAPFRTVPHRSARRIMNYDMTRYHKVSQYMREDKILYYINLYHILSYTISDAIF